MRKRVNTNVLVERFRSVHGDFYDYSKVEYVADKVKVCIICPEHGEFWQLPYNHTLGKGCLKCGFRRSASQNRLNQFDFIKRAKEANPTQEYDYSKVEYVNNKTKVKVTCKYHGDFVQSPYHLLKGIGCQKCGSECRGNSIKAFHKSKRPDLSHITTPPGSKAVPVGTKGDYALVDDEDYEKCMEYNWKLTGGYAANSLVGKMHRFIMNPPDDMDVDHIYHDKLDNRKSQLRVCTHQENIINSRQKSGRKYKGVSRTAYGKWAATIKPADSDTTFWLGAFNTEEEAAKAYDEAAKKYHKEFAYLNNIK